MNPFILSPDAWEDTWLIWQNLAEISAPAVADRIESELFSAFETLARVPGLGHLRPDLTSHQVYFWAVYQYMIVYRKSDPLEIVAVIHGKRDIQALLGKRQIH